MEKAKYSKVTGLSGNEIFLLDKLGFKAGQFCLGNEVVAIGVGRGIGAGLSTLAGGEVAEVTKLVHDGRTMAYERMMAELHLNGGDGLAGMSFDMIRHGGNLEFIAQGSAVHRKDGNAGKKAFSTSASGQHLYCQLDAGYNPLKFVFGNVAYSIGVGGSIKGALRGLLRGEVKEYTEIFDRTRHLALSRIKDEAKAAGANAVVGIKTSIMPLLGTQEMMMLGTASHHPLLDEHKGDPVTSDLTNQELWNLANMGYMPVELVLGTSVYSLGLLSGITSSLLSLVGGRIDSLVEILYEAREKALQRVNSEAERVGADEVVNIKTRIYDMGGGLIEFMVIGTAVRKMPGIATAHDALPPQAIVQEDDTFVDSTTGGNKNLAASNAGSARQTQRGPLSIIITLIVMVVYGISLFLEK